MELPDCFGPACSDISALTSKKTWDGDVKKYPRYNISMHRRLFRHSCEFENRLVNITASLSTSSYTNVSLQIESSTRKRRRSNYLTDCT